MKNELHIDTSLAPLDEEEFQQFADALEGWKIVEVKSVETENHPEGWFQLRLERDDREKKVVFYATELGAWAKQKKI